MVNQAEQNAAADKERREKIDRKNQADSLAYQAEKQLTDLGDKVPAADKTKVEGLVKDLRDAVSQDDDEQIKKVMPELQQALFAVGSNLYQQAGASTPDGGPGPDGGSSTPPSGGEDVIDADFTETK
jgi:molecular chaperone DnaK